MAERISLLSDIQKKQMSERKKGDKTRRQKETKEGDKKGKKKNYQECKVAPGLYSTPPPLVH